MNDDNRNKKSNRSGLIVCLVAALIFVLFLSYFSKLMAAAQTQEISYNEFLALLENGKVDSVLITDSRIEITPKSGSTSISPTSMYGYSETTYYTGVINDPDLVARLSKSGVRYSREVVDKSSTIFEVLISYLLPFVIIYVVMYFLFRAVTKNGGGIMNVGKSNAKVYVEKDTGITFKDVAGQEEAKESVQELVDFLHNPGKYTKIGAKLPKGALLVGPPGTGKTLLAKAVAGEAKVPFFSLAGSDFVEMYVGVGASRVRDLFKQAQAQAPCIIFIDEVDAIGKSRDSRYGGGNDEREQTLNQLLSEMDGFDTSKGIVILAATNRPEILDKALLRPGRFDRRIIVNKPDLKGRLETLRVHSRNVLMEDSVDLDAIALATAGAVGSELANIINEAAILAVKEGRHAVCQADLFESVEVVFAGKEKKNGILTEKEKKIVAYHEVGHAMIAALQKHTEPVQKITIVPRTMGALGYTMLIPEEEKNLSSKEELTEQIIVSCGGRAAEEIVFGSITNGAAGDIDSATQVARTMISRYGMSDKFGMMGLGRTESQYLEGRYVMECADSTSAEVDREVLRLISDCYARAKELLSENREKLDKIAAFLLKEETITGKQFMEIFNEDENAEKEAETGSEEHETARSEAGAENITSGNETGADENAAGNETAADDNAAENEAGAGDEASAENEEIQ